MHFQNLKIGTRLTTAFILVLFMLCIVAVTGLSSLGGLRQAMVNITKANDVESRLALEMRMSVDDRMIALRNLVLLKDQTDLQEQLARMKAQSMQYDTAENKLKETFAMYGIRDDEKRLLEEIHADSVVATPLIAKVSELAQSNDHDGAVNILFGDLRTVQRHWASRLDALSEIERIQNVEALAISDASYGTARVVMIGLSVASVICGLGLAWFITRGITKPINIAVAVAQAVASGNLTSIIDSDARDETGILLTALKEMNTSLLKIVTEVRTGTDAMSVSSSEIADGNMDLSSRTEDQASSLEETASSMEEMTATVRQNADNAHQGNKLAELAKDAARKGGVVIASVVTTMEEINSSSKRIAEIVGVIDGIAFQTNILALNAAVEAARAGEQGRGFAVVASEVRNLAQRSAAAAKEIKTMINESVAKVDSGSLLVDEAGRTMNDVVVSVDRVTSIMAEISNASQEQSAGIEQINQAIMTMDNVTQQNAALVEQSAAAAQSLQDQSVHLAQVVGMFVLSPQQRVSTAIRHRRALSGRLAIA
ncbi:MAG: methyl-accepting chemotaxis protein [Pseudomonadota bacterium]|nr:methyl-accepting chemotaxis protein [Pseudomonadota bacterium]